MQARPRRRGPPRPSSLGEATGQRASRSRIFIQRPPKSTRMIPGLKSFEGYSLIHPSVKIPDCLWSSTMTSAFRRRERADAHRSAEVTYRLKLRLVVPIAETAADLFYKRLFEHKPVPAVLLRRTWIDRSELVAMLSFIVRSLDWDAESQWREDVDPEEDLFCSRARSTPREALSDPR